MKNFIQNPNQNVVITFDNNETLARIYEDNKVVAKGVAHCNPEDEFDMVLGSTLALSRAWEAMSTKKQEWVVVKRNPRPGDYIRITKKEYPFDEVGDILKVYSTGLSRTDWANVLIDEHPKCKAHIEKETGGNWPFITWCYRSDEFEVVEPVTKKSEQTKKPEYRKLTRLPKDGDYAKIIHSMYDFDDPELFLPIRGVVNRDDHYVGFYVLNKEHPGAMKFDREHPPVEWRPDQEWHYNYQFNTIEFYEKV